MKCFYRQAIETLIYLLEKEKSYPQWVEWLKKDIKDFKEEGNVNHHLQAYGGMGSLNDLYLSELNDEEKKLFHIMKEFCYQFTFFYKRIHEDVNVLQADVLHEVLYKDKRDKNPLYVLILDGLQSGDFLDFYLHDNQYKNIKEVTFYRQSVCMADDMNENTKVYSIHVNRLYDSIISTVNMYHFLPSVSGNDVVWVVKNHLGQEILSYFTKENRIIRIINEMTIDEVCQGKCELYFQYYTSPQKRGCYLLKLYNGKKKDMFHDGVMDEYQLCHMSKELEEEMKK